MKKIFIFLLLTLSVALQGQLKPGTVSSQWSTRTYLNVLTKAATPAWYEAHADYITVVTGVSAWSDKSGNSHNLAQSTGALQPAFAADSVSFDGTDDVIFTGAFTMDQPFVMYWVMRINSYTADDKYWSGRNTTTYFYQSGGTPRLRLYFGSDGTTNPNLLFTTWGLVTIIVNGASSSIQVNDNAAIGCSIGTNNPAGICFGAQYGAGGYGHFSIKEVIFNTSLTAGDITLVKAFLNDKYSIY